MTELLQYKDNEIEFLNKCKKDDFEKSLNQIYERNTFELKKQLEEIKITKDLIYAKYLTLNNEYRISPYEVIKTYYLNKENKFVFGNFMNQHCKNPDDSAWDDYFSFQYKLYGTSSCGDVSDMFTACENCESILNILAQFNLID